MLTVISSVKCYFEPEKALFYKHQLNFKITVDLFIERICCIFSLFPGIKPTSDAWSEETVVMLKKLVCNRFLRVEILGERDGTALVSMVDESSDPQTNVAELLVSTGHAAVGNMEKKEAVESPGESQEYI